MQVALAAMLIDAAQPALPGKVRHSPYAHLPVGQFVASGLVLNLRLRHLCRTYTRNRWYTKRLPLWSGMTANSLV
jgi:hypothetical protein